MKTNEPKSKIGVIILAAGSSSRLGTPKQLVEFRGETLLKKIALESLKSVCSPVLVVLGKDAEKFAEKLENLDVQIAENQNWQCGMGASIGCGIKEITKSAVNLEAVILCVCDQPFVTSATLNNLAAAFLTRKCKIVASAYQETIGVPAIFDKSLFSELAELNRESGAKKIIEKFSSETFLINFSDGAIDVDTPEDLRKIQEDRKT